MSITTQAQIDQNNADYAAGWPTDDAAKKPEPAATNPNAFYTSDEIAARELEAQQAAARKA